MCTLCTLCSAPLIFRYCTCPSVGVQHRQHFPPLSHPIPTPTPLPASSSASPSAPPSSLRLNPPPITSHWASIPCLQDLAESREELWVDSTRPA